MDLTIEYFKNEIETALAVYDKYVVCLEKTPDECRESLESLTKRAINVFENRGPNLRHGIALDKHVTVMLSQTNREIPLCAIYFNLCSPYHREKEKAEKNSPAPPTDES
jgi:hypothetical protein